MIDSHCHLDFPNFQKDFDEVFARARAAGVKKILNPGCDLATSQAAVALAEKYEEISAAVGVHPHDAAEANSATLAELEKLARSCEKVVAIGEIGLDYFRLRAAKEVQISAFRAQLALAAKLGLPVIIHARDSVNETLAILAEFPQLRGVFHCFAGDFNAAEEVLAAGFSLGFTGIITFPKAVELRAVVQHTSLEKILIETDAPFLAPQKYRGKRCEPAFVREVAVAIAEIKKTSFVEVEVATTRNAERLFRI